MTEPEPQELQFHTQAAFGASQDYQADWVLYAMNTEAPDFVGGIDQSRNPYVEQAGDGAAYA